MIITEETKEKIKNTFYKKYGSLKTRFISRIKKLDSGCWQWIGTIDISNGYGRLSYKHKEFMAHRVSYNLHRGEIEKGLVIDHLCKNKWCVNPEHLEPVTIGENVLRGDGITARNLKKTHCPYGHEYIGKNLYINPRGNRVCRQCIRNGSRIRLGIKPENYKRSKYIG